MARSARYKTQSGKYVASITAFSENLDNLGAQAAVEAARDGAEAMRGVVATSGTGWEGRGPGSPRADSGDMLDDISYDKVALRDTSRTGRISRVARFGWINRIKDYYRYQDRGFSNLRKNEDNRGNTWTTGRGGWTEGMEAVATGRLVASASFQRHLRRITRAAWRRSR